MRASPRLPARGLHIQFCVRRTAVRNVGFQRSWGRDAVRRFICQRQPRADVAQWGFRALRDYAARTDQQMYE